MIERDACITLIEQTYFGNVQRGDLDATMACFTADAHVRIRHGDNPERRFGVEPNTGEASLRDFYVHLCGNYTAWFGAFIHYIDGDEDRAASRFTVHLSPKPDGQYADAGKQELLNCNFFEFRAGLISDMIIYYSNPTAGAASSQQPGAPTGYPPSG